MASGTVVLRPFAARSRTQVIILERGCTLRVVLEKGDDVAAQHPQLYTNHPLPEEKFVRNKRRLVKEIAAYDGSADWVADLPINCPGSFDLTLEISGQSVFQEDFVVEPELRVNGKSLPLDGVMVQTVLTKCLGPLKEWDAMMKLPAECGFNMIHFSPIQHLGHSGSCYSIYDQLLISRPIFPEQPELSEHDKERQLKAFLDRNAAQRGLLAITDVVWNHTADNTPWLSEHPEAGYASCDSLTLTMAFELDTALLDYSAAIVRGEVLGVSAAIESEEDIKRVMERFRKDEWQKLRIWEYVVLDVEGEVKRFKDAIHGTSLATAPALPFEDLCRSLQAAAGNVSFTRLGSRADLAVAQRLFGVTRGPETSTLELCVAHYERALRLVNLWFYQRLDAQLEQILTNVSNRIRYERLETGGPKRGPLTHRYPLIETYFVRVKPAGKAEIGLACNGWIWNADPRIDFAASTSWSYFIREVIVWSDCVKLRYGSARADNPWLWDHMATYTTRMASLFDGFRVDNAHSTPLPVAQYMLDLARQVRPNLYVTAELFTGSAELDAKYVSALGINSLIREAMNAGSPADLSHTLYMYGVGRPVGNLRRNAAQSSVRREPRALLFDCTHDNPTPAQKRTPEDFLSNAALVSIASSAFGSTRGYDELVPRTLDIVAEKRRYRERPADAGILGARALLNRLHADLADFEEVHVHQEGPIIMVQRHNPRTHEAVFVLVHTAFKSPPPLPSSIELPAGELRKALFVSQVKLLEQSDAFVPLTDVISGLKTAHFVSTHAEDFRRLVPISAGRIQITQHFSPGSVAAFAYGLTPPTLAAATWLRTSMRASAAEAVRSVDLDALNVLLYRSEPEEFDTTGSRGYDVPGFGKLPYCGIASLVALFDTGLSLGHALCAHLRSGDWLLGFQGDRLQQKSSLAPVRSFFCTVVEKVSALPRHLVPCYFELILDSLYDAARGRFLSLVSPFVQSGDDFVQRLALCSVQLHGVVPSAPLLARSPELGSLAAGLPFFSSGFMRNWGRDTFISLRGLLLVTGRLHEAKNIILAYAASVRHGLVPNLLDGGRKPRFNCRDAPWWFLQAVQDYVAMATVAEGNALLASSVERLFEGRDSMPLAEVLQEILQAHASGIEFREQGAGPDLDRNMTNEGFNISVHLDPATGFVSGGNPHNCGTWMDKMGESQSAGNKGVPATPRDGAAVEIVGLTASTVRWLASLSSAGRYRHKGVVLPSGTTFTFAQWAEVLKQNFERFFYVPLTNERGQFELRQDLVHKRGIYKDTLGASAAWCDYQLRPNFTVAMAVAPELFDEAHAANALRMVEAHLLGPLGMRTLDPADWAYRPDYVNSLDNGDRAVSKGFNYHQGPEWLWPVGFYLRALIVFARPLSLSPPSLRHKLARVLRAHRAHIQMSLWAGLPELTNRNGATCNDSCPSQAWSAATLLDALADLAKH